MKYFATGAAIVALMATGALAQSSSSSASMSSAAESSASSSMTSSSTASSTTSSTSSSMMDSSAMSSDMSVASSIESSVMPSSSEPTVATPSPRKPITISSGYSRVDTDQLATKIIGQPVYDGTDANADNLGKINDLVVNGDGSIAAVVIGVGGFLGLGEKQVAVDFSALQLVVASDNTKRFVVKTTKDELTNAPDFKTVDTTPSQAASDMSMSSSSSDQSAASSSSAQ